MTSQNPPPSTLPEGWATAYLEDLVEILDGRRIPVNSSEREARKAKKTKGRLYPYYGATGQVDTIDGYLFSGKHLLLGEDGAPFYDAYKAKAYLASGEFWVNNHAHILKSYAGISAEYLCHLLNIIDYHPYVAGTTRLKLTQASLRSISVRLAPESEQSRIASRIEELFSDLDKGEENLRRAQAQLKRYRQSVLKAAVTGELTRAWREQNADKLESGEALLARILKARRAAWEKAELEKLRAKGKLPLGDAWKSRYVEPQGPSTEGLPELPGGWAWASVGQLIAEPLKTGLSIKGDSSPPGVPSLRLNSICNGRIDWSKIKYLPVSESDVSDIQVQDGDFFIARGNGSLDLVGKGARAETPRFFCIYPDIMIRLRFLPGLRAEGYLCDIWDSLLIRSQIQQMAKTTAGIYKISQAQVMSLAVPLPSLDEQKRIAESLSSSYAVQDVMLKELSSALRQARALRQSILKAAFSGKLVPQDPNDEPAGELLQRIAAERAAQGAHPGKSAAQRIPSKPRKARAAAQPTASAPAAPSGGAESAPAPGLAAARLVAARKAAGLSQAQLAERAGVNQAYVSQMETGKRAITAGQAAALARALGIEPSALTQA